MSSYGHTRVLSLAAAVSLLVAACSPDPGGSAEEGGGRSLPTAPEQGADTGAAASGASLTGADTAGVDIAQGEWALVSSALEAPPGAITFRFRNQGTVPHALRIRTAGSGGDRLEWRAEAIGPGQSGVLVADLSPGTYEIDCPIEDGHGEHHQLGMEILFNVREGAPGLAPLAEKVPPVAQEAAATGVAIAAFAFEPAELGVPAGITVVWTNTDPTPHKVTGDTFGTGVLEPGTTGSVTFETAGTFDYFCAIHPTMGGRVVVEP